MSPLTSSSRVCPCFLRQSPEKHRQAIVEIVGEAEKRRAYLAQMASTRRENDRKVEGIAKVTGCWAGQGRSVRGLAAALTQQMDPDDREWKGCRDAVRPSPAAARYVGRLLHPHGQM